LEEKERRSKNEKKTKRKISFW